jgi:flagellar hook-associated protein 1 FlgK
MGSLTSLFNLATTALGVDQHALSVTANNVANQNTVGYTREVATFQSGDTVSLGVDGGSETSPTLTVASQRNRVLEQQVQQQTQTTSASGERAANLTQIENVFGLSSDSATAGSTQIGAAVDGFFSSLSALSSNPADLPTQQAVISAAKTLSDSLNSAASQLAGVSSSVNGTLASSVTAVNGLTATIAGLNQKIAALSPNADAGTLEDQRQSAIAQLSGYIGLDQITTEHNGITLATTSGVPLVSGTSSFALSTASVAGVTQVQDSSGTNLNSEISGGSIGGDLATLNVDLPQASNGLDTLAYRIATAVNTQNAAGVTGNGTAGSAIFSIPGTAAGSAAAISVIPTSGSALASGSTGEGSSGNTNALALAAIQQATDPSGTTIDTSFAALLSSVGNSVSSVSEGNAAQQATLTQLTTQRDSLSAVSLDEEASNLTTYQNSYNAAAKLFGIVNSLMVSSINLGTETTVS